MISLPILVAVLPFTTIEIPPPIILICLLLLAILISKRPRLYLNTPSGFPLVNISSCQPVIDLEQSIFQKKIVYRMYYSCNNLAGNRIRLFVRPWWCCFSSFRNSLLPHAHSLSLNAIAWWKWQGNGVVLKRPMNSFPKQVFMEADPSAVIYDWKKGRRTVWGSGNCLHSISCCWRGGNESNKNGN